MDKSVIAVYEAKIAKLYDLLALEGSSLEVPAPLAKALHRELIKTESDLARLLAGR